MAERWEEIAKDLGSYDMTYTGWGHVPDHQMVLAEGADLPGEYVRAEPACKRIAELEIDCDLYEQGSKDLARLISKLRREVEVLRRYGNRDCTAMADEVLSDTQEGGARG